MPTALTVSDTGRRIANTLYSNIGGKSIKLTIKQAIIQQAIPNFIFHVTTAYSILRAKGVPVGKGDFISSFINN